MLRPFFTGLFQASVMALSLSFPPPPSPFTFVVLAFLLSRFSLFSDYGHPALSALQSFSPQFCHLSLEFFFLIPAFLWVFLNGGFFFFFRL